MEPYGALWSLMEPLWSLMGGVILALKVVCQRDQVVVAPAPRPVADCKLDGFCPRKRQHKQRPLRAAAAAEAAAAALQGLQGLYKALKASTRLYAL